MGIAREALVGEGSFRLACSYSQKMVRDVPVPSSAVKEEGLHGYATGIPAGWGGSIWAVPLALARCLHCPAVKPDMREGTDRSQHTSRRVSSCGESNQQRAWAPSQPSGTEAIFALSWAACCSGGPPFPGLVAHNNHCPISLLP